jgi:tRNA threonylcarbamoyladenosine biosynthesis protein TsaE
MKIINSRSPFETEKAGEDFASNLTESKNLLVALYGDIGAGKTCFFKGVAKGFGIQGTVNSPTFSIINCYQGKKLPIFHIDAYRLKGHEEILNIGFEDYVSDGICFIEWPERIESLLPKSVIKVRFNIDNETERTITIE